MKYKKIKIFTDGGARGNPGPAGIGAIAYGEDDEIIGEKSEFIGRATNNQAEYRAVIAAFDLIGKFEADEVNFFLDSELVVKQLKGEYRVKNQELAPFFLKIHNLKQKYKKISFTHIRREFNKEADRLANEAMDRSA